MTAGSGPSLAEQRQSIRAQLRAQRQRVAERLAPVAGFQGRYPRSVTMRLLLDRPDLLARLAALISGARVAVPVRAILVLVNLLRVAAAVDAPKALAAPQPGNDQVLP